MAEYKLIEYSESMFDEWNEFVKESNNGTIFHRLDFLQYHKNHFKDNENNLVWLKNNKMYAVMPLAVFKENGKKVGKSPYGASYGGLITSGKIKYIEIEQFSLDFNKYIAEKGIETVVITNPPIIYYKKACNYYEFLLLKNDSKLINSDLTAYISIDEDVQVNYHRSAKKSVRKSIKNKLFFEESDDLDSFYKILVENRNKFSSKPVHTKENLRYLLDLMKDHVYLFMVYKDRVPVAGSIVFSCNSKVILAFYWAHVEKYSEYSPINYLVYKISQWAYRRGYSIFDFGTQTVEMIPNYGGTNFKETLGSRGVLRSTYVLKSN
jgi:hypothetical protein